MATIDLTIHFDTAFHLGGDNSRFSVARDSRGRAVIFASTLRGIHRAAVEGIAAALGLDVCNSSVAVLMCQPLPGQSVCAACRIFGSPWVSGRIYHPDLVTNAAPQVET